MQAEQGRVEVRAKRIDVVEHEAAQLGVLFQEPQQHAVAQQVRNLVPVAEGMEMGLRGHEDSESRERRRRLKVTFRSLENEFAGVDGDSFRRDRPKGVRIKVPAESDGRPESLDVDLDSADPAFTLYLRFSRGAREARCSFEEKLNGRSLRVRYSQATVADLRLGISTGRVLLVEEACRASTKTQYNGTTFPPIVLTFYDHPHTPPAR